MKICSKCRYSSSWVTKVAISLVFTLATTTLGAKAFAQSNTQPFDSNRAEYYTIDETQTSLVSYPVSPDISPVNNFSFLSITAYARSLALNLLRWTLHAEAPKQPYIKYDRKFHFGRWINDPKDDTCYNTRAKVLIRDSEALVSFKEKNHCLVEKGDWADPYAGTTILESHDIQIDHMVPLKNAYLSGAWEWNFQTRCVYANFMGNKFHLIAASGHENMSKGDKAPDRYMPPNESYRCQYLENWLKIKLIWRLKMTPSEVEAIRDGIKNNACDSRKFSLSAAELKLQRKLIYDNSDLCPAR